MSLCFKWICICIIHFVLFDVYSLYLFHYVSHSFTPWWVTYKRIIIKPLIMRWFQCYVINMFYLKYVWYFVSNCVHHMSWNMSLHLLWHSTFEITNIILFMYSINPHLLDISPNTHYPYFSPQIKMKIKWTRVNETCSSARVEVWNMKLQAFVLV